MVDRNSRVISLLSLLEKFGIIHLFLILYRLALFKLKIRDKFKIPKYQHLFYLRRNTSDLPALRQVFFNEDYDFKLGFNPKNIVDLGANVGFASIYFAHKYKGAKVVAVEPEENNYVQLCLNVKSYENIIPFKAAVWSANTNLSISINSEYGEWGARVCSTVGSGGPEVEAITLEEIMNRFSFEKIDILKVDIETAERELFKNCEKWIEQVRVIVIELHDFMDPGSSNTFFKALATLEKFSIEISGENLIVRNLNIKD